MPTFPAQGGSQDTWGTELRAFFDTFFDLSAGTLKSGVIPNSALVQITDASKLPQDIATTASPSFRGVTLSPASPGAPMVLGATGQGQLVTGLDADQLDSYHAGNGSGNVPVSNGTINTNLNADMLEGKHASATPGADTVVISNGSGKLAAGWISSGIASTLATLDSNTQVVERLSYEGDASGVATLDANTQVVETPAQMTLIPSFENYRNLIVTTNATNPTYQVDIDADAARLANSTGTFKKLSSVNLTVDITVAGANGLDTGAEGSSTWYHLWIIAKADGTTAGLLSTSTTLAGLTMPTGYTFGGYVGAVRNDGSSNFIAFYQEGCRVEYAATVNIKDGTFTTGAWTAQAVTTQFPPTAKRISVWYGSASGQFGVSPRSDGRGGDYMSAAPNAGTTAYGIFTTVRAHIMALSIRYVSSIYYWAANAASTLDAIGWEY